MHTYTYIWVRLLYTGETGLVSAVRYRHCTSAGGRGTETINPAIGLIRSTLSNQIAKRARANVSESEREVTVVSRPQSILRSGDRITDQYSETPPRESHLPDRLSTPPRAPERHVELNNRRTIGRSINHTKWGDGSSQGPRQSRTLPDACARIK